MVYSSRESQQQPSLFPELPKDPSVQATVAQRRINIRENPEAMANRAVLLDSLVSSLTWVSDGKLESVSDLHDIDHFIEAFILYDEVAFHSGTDLYGCNLEYEDLDDHAGNSVRGLISDSLPSAKYLDVLSEDFDIFCDRRRLKEVSLIHESDLLCILSDESAPHDLVDTSVNDEELEEDSDEWDEELKRLISLVAPQDRERFISLMPSEPYRMATRSGCWGDFLCLVCKCRGIPIFSACNSYHAPEPQLSTIGGDLYKRLSLEHSEEFRKIEQHLGKLWLSLPPFTQIALSRCQNPSELPQRIGELRDEFSKLRKSLSTLSLDLRTATNVDEHIRIISSIEESYSAHARRWKKPERKAVYKLFDIVKPTDLKGSALGLLSKLIDYDIERESIIRLDGLNSVHGAWMKSDEARSSVERLWGVESLQKVFSQQRLTSATASTTV